MHESDETGREGLEQELTAFLSQLEEGLEWPMIVLAFGWLVLLVVELIWGLSPLLQGIGTVIWILFIVDFLVRFAVAPHKGRYVKRNWLTALSLLLPALRVLRVARALRLVRVARATRGLRLFRVVSSLNRGMRALRSSMRRRGVGYVAALTLVIVLVGAAGMYAFEGEPAGEQGLDSYAEALWWTAMLLTTIGSEYWPSTPEGRILCLLLSVYGLGILGYITATLASFFVGRDAADETAELAGAQALERLRAECESLRLEIQRLSRSS